MPDPVVLSWSSGKDSLMTLVKLREEADCEIHALLATLSQPYQRISMHGVRSTLLQRQVDSLGYQLDTVWLPAEPDNETYVSLMSEALGQYQRQGINHIAFGDLWLADVRRYREQMLSELGLAALFPLWATPTMELGRTFIAKGYRAILTCVDATQLSPSFVGQEYDAALLDRLPDGVDPCGEQGEFHTFVYDGPAFAYPIAFNCGEKVVQQNRFHFLDLIPK